MAGLIVTSGIFHWYKPCVFYTIACKASRDECKYIQSGVSRRTHGTDATAHQSARMIAPLSQGNNALLLEFFTTRRISNFFVAGGFFSL
jgi:hypothetical protein